MPIDIFNSRATYNVICKWWQRKENDDDIDLDEYVSNRVSSGSFHAKEVAPLRKQDAQIGGVFKIENHFLTIKSPDDLKDISEKDIVEFNGEHWRVISVQRSKARNQNTFFANDKNCSHYWYLELSK